MASGFKEMVINTQERAVSTDINRLQKFKSADIAEIFRTMMNSYGNDDVDAGGVLTELSATGNPLVGEIMSGLMVEVQNASLNVTVSEGVGWFMQPDAVADDSDYKLVRDPGSGTLTITANSSGSIRVDVIECSLSFAAPVTATDNRDIFNSVTGLFAATSVTKETRVQLTYRVRAGTPGSGYPGPAMGWLPLAVASVPNGTTTNDTITFWDVRPMVGDRVRAPFNRTLDNPRQQARSNWECNNDANGGTESRINGYVNAELNGYRVGGRIRSTVPQADSGINYIDARNAIHQQSGISIPATGLVYLYLCTPYGLPRWARYKEVAEGTRVPRSPRGLFLVSSVAPTHAYGKPSGTISPPAITGLVTAIGVNDAVCVGALPTVASAITGGVMDGRVFYRDPYQSVVQFSNSGVTSLIYRLTAGTHYPHNAKALIVDLYINYNVLAGGISTWNGDINVADQGGIPGAIYAQTFGSGGFIYNSAGITEDYAGYSGNVRIPLRTNYPADTATGVDIQWVISAAFDSLNTSLCYCHVLGWDLGEA